MTNTKFGIWLRYQLAFLVEDPYGWLRFCYWNSKGRMLCRLGRHTWTQPIMKIEDGVAFIGPDCCFYCQRDREP